MISGSCGKGLGTGSRSTWAASPGACGRISPRMRGEEEPAVMTPKPYFCFRDPRVRRPTPLRRFPARDVSQSDRRAGTPCCSIFGGRPVDPCQGTTSRRIRTGIAHATCRALGRNQDRSMITGVGGITVTGAAVRRLESRRNHRASKRGSRPWSLSPLQTWPRRARLPVGRRVHRGMVR